MSKTCEGQGKHGTIKSQSQTALEGGPGGGGGYHRGGGGEGSSPRPETIHEVMV